MLQALMLPWCGRSFLTHTMNLLEMIMSAQGGGAVQQIGQQFGLNPWLWLKDTLTRLPVTPVDQLSTLLPTPSAK